MLLEMQLAQSLVSQSSYQLDLVQQFKTPLLQQQTLIQLVALQLTSIQMLQVHTQLQQQV